MRDGRGGWADRVVGLEGVRVQNAMVETRTTDVVADERPRPMAGIGVDAVIRARRRS